MNKSLEKFTSDFAHMIRTDRNGKPAIDNETAYGDGYWVYLKDGLIFDNDTHIVHEYSVAALRASMKRVGACNCKTCVSALRDRYEPFGYDDPSFPYDPFNGATIESHDTQLIGAINKQLYNAGLDVLELVRLNMDLERGISVNCAYSMYLETYQF